MYSIINELHSKLFKHQAGPVKTFDRRALAQNFNKHRTSSYPYNYKIQQFIHCRPFEFSFPRILHQFRILTGEYDNSITPLRVFYHAASQHYPIVIQNVPANKKKHNYKIYPSDLKETGTIQYIKTEILK